jgi:glycosyltransferase involved in cell wall biosynthesis
MLIIALKGWPRLSETFVAQELLALQEAGIPFTIVSLRRPTETKTHALHQRITAPVLYLPEYLHQEPLRVLKALFSCGRHAKAFWGQARRDIKRDFSRSRLRRIGQALVLAHELPQQATFFYAHFLHTPATVTHYAALLTGRRFAISAHAKDIYTSPAWDVAQKIAAAAWVVTCSEANMNALRAVTPTALHPRLHRLYHGLDGTRFPPCPTPPSLADGHSIPVRLLSVGRAVPKKGYDTLLAAMARLSPTLQWEFHHIGGGALLPALKAQAAAAGIAQRLTWHGAQSGEIVLEQLRQAAIFVLASHITEDGDRDGLPNVLMEAMSQRLACLSTTVSAIPELITDGENGRLVPPNDPAALTVALEWLITHPSERLRLAQRGESVVRERFVFQAQVPWLIERLRQELA